MPSTRIQIVTPAPAGSRSGNRNTARRWAGILRGLGVRARITTQWDGQACDLLIVLHARRSGDSLRRFQARHPQRPVLLALTGTDLYRDIHEDAQAAAALDQAQGLIVLQATALRELSDAQRCKARVIHQSVAAARPHRPPRRPFRVCVLGHLREEKDPFCAARALRWLADEPLEVVHIGAALTPAMARQAQRFMARDERYRWLGELPHGKALQWLARSHVLVISSLMEGGAHVVSEAIAGGVPVIASDIPGNRGLLGEAYPAYFPARDARRLAQLLQRARQDEAYLKRLAEAVKAQRALVDPASERQAWRELLRDFRMRPAGDAPGQSCADGCR